MSRGLTRNRTHYTSGWCCVQWWANVLVAACAVGAVTHWVSSDHGLVVPKVSCLHPPRRNKKYIQGLLTSAQCWITEAGRISQACARFVDCGCRVTWGTEAESESINGSTLIDTLFYFFILDSIVVPHTLYSSQKHKHVAVKYPRIRTRS